MNQRPALVPVARAAGSSLVAALAVLGAMALLGCGSQKRTASSTTAEGFVVVDHHSPDCIPPAFRLFGPRPAPVARSTTLPTSILSSFAILRRGARALDMRGGLVGELGTDYELASYYPAYVRRLSPSARGRRYFVIPAFARAEAVPPAHCFRGGVRRELVEQEHRRSTEPVYCIIGVGSRGEVPGCEPFVQVAGSVRAFFTSDFIGEPTVELVPDGVASVRVTYAAAAPVLAHVYENAFLLTPPRPPKSPLDSYLKRLVHQILQGPKAERERVTREYNRAYLGTYPTKIEWLDRADGIVRALAPPTAESIGSTSLGQLRAPVEGS